MKIFVTVGSTYPLDRLIKELDLICESKKYKKSTKYKTHKIFAQIGESKYKPKNIEFTKFLSYEEMQSKIKWANLIISHAGAGSIIDLLTSGKKFILFPRLKEYGEAIDNHQLEICKAFSKKYGIKYTANEKEIANYLKIKNKRIIKEKDNELLSEIKKILE
jgi:UDP-N-acetylglucosamine transferase subunit ALG13